MVNYAATPQRAALHAFQRQSPPASIGRINVVGRYAAVVVRGLRTEGSLVKAPILVERFSFGWQAVDVLNDTQCPGAHGMSSGVQRSLMREMPKPEYNRKCSSIVLTDSGPAMQVEAVRRMMRGPLVPFVFVSGSYALGGYFGAGGGQSVYVLRHGEGWHLLDSGGGAFGVPEMRAMGVPRETWCALKVYDAKCARPEPHRTM